MNLILRNTKQKSCPAIEFPLCKKSTNQLFIPYSFQSIMSASFKSSQNAPTPPLSPPLSLADTEAVWYFPLSVYCNSPAR